MIKKLPVLSISLYYLFVFSSAFAACPPATPTNAPGFCSSFKLAAQCHCTSSGLPLGMCTNMRALYDRMNSMFGSVRRACEYQHETSPQNCIDSWNCYWSGGRNSQNELCSGTGRSCE